VDDQSPAILRHPEPGDLGWIVHRHGLLYSAEYGFGVQFEGIVAEIVSDFAKGHDPAKERCWIAEVDGQKAGSVMLVECKPGIAKLRILLVEPFARGRGVGQALIDACIDFAREAGYGKIVLWTESELLSARRLYQKAGFRLTSQEAHQHFGSPKTGETWELDL
jgi:GNAT superfamily N-acetyltransferase